MKTIKEIQRENKRDAQRYAAFNLAPLDLSYQDPFKITLGIKPMSVNKAFQGRRFRSDDYDAYERYLMFSLPHMILPEPPYSINFEFGFSNMGADVDNPVKPLMDILAKKYGFNDKEVHQIAAKKVKVPKGLEYFTVKIETI